MSTYPELVKSDKNFVPNILIRLGGEFFSLRDPDSGLTIKPEYRGLVGTLTLNPTTNDPRRVATTIAEASFTLLDVNGAVTAMVGDTAEDLIGTDVDIYIGRVGVGLSAADYYKLPTTKVRKLSKPDDRYTFAVSQDTDRINRATYQAKSRVAGDIFADTTSFFCKDDLTPFPAAGFLLIENELMSYSGVNTTTGLFSGLQRGLFGTTAVDHSDDTGVALAEHVEDNPLNIILRILTSAGGGGAYDDLLDGVALDVSLIDVAAIEAVRDAYYSDVTFRLVLSAIDNALTMIEDELLFPNNLRFGYSANEKLTVVPLNRPSFVEEDDVTDHDTLTRLPQWAIDGYAITNSVALSWDYDDATGIFGVIQTYTDAASVAKYGIQNPVVFEWKGVRSDLDGETIVQAFLDQYFGRLAVPLPVITVSTQLDQSLLKVADKTILRTDKVPNKLGYLKFDAELEIMSSSINWQTGDVKQTLMFTTFTGVRNCYLAPSDTLVAVTSQHEVEIGAGRGAQWLVGWNVRLWDNVARDYTADPVNKILSVVGDVITFENDFVTALTTDHRLKFPDFDNAVAGQRRYCFINATGFDFSTSQESYKITP